MVRAGVFCHPLNGRLRRTRVRAPLTRVVDAVEKVAKGDRSCNHTLS